ncbi:MAG TPA: hypothetical protein PKK50_08260 [Myxococcota bacterium]|nr:hypothetical protein [Myxococcota bacterium]HNZ04122.1 hypothetical protein [Myxococcota bacterium]HOD08014.1 hypothetical protein [Myxococcota bacterium]
MKRVVTFFAVLLLAGCGGGGGGGSGTYSALESCDYASNCVAAVQKALAATNPSPELLAGVLHVRMNSLMKSPPLEPEYLTSIGISREQGFAIIGADIERLEGMEGGEVYARDAKAVLKFMQTPSCEYLTELELLRKSGGKFADSAATAGISALTQLFTAITPENSSYVAVAMRMLVGCDVSDRAGAGAIVVATRARLSELLENCPTGNSGDAVLLSMCEEGRKQVSDRDIPLPITDGTSGETAGAFPPQGRSIGLAMNPPWIFSLSAGRLAVYDQPVLKAGLFQVPDAVPEVLIDLRDVHRPEDVKTAIHHALNGRGEWRRTPDEKSGFLFFVVDRTTTFADLAEVMAAMSAETDAFPLIAVLPRGAASPVWRPMNFFISTRQLYSPDGKRSSWNAPVDGKEPIDGKAPTGHLEFELNPFSLRMGDRVVEIARASGGLVNSGYDVRGVNALAAEMIAAGRPRAARIKVSQAVTVEMLETVLEAMAYRFPKEAMESASAFNSAQEIRKEIGRYEYLLGWVVLDVNW